jgi:hypothetical protein
MMSLLALPLPIALVAAEPVAEPSVENEIEVIGNKLRNWSSSFKLRKGAVDCKTKRSTGDKAIDAIGCNAVVRCTTPFAGEWQAINDSKGSKAEKSQQLAAIFKGNAVTDCVVQDRNDGIAALAAERRSKRS